MSKGTTYLCPWCNHKVILYVRTNFPPMHQCGGSTLPEKYLPMHEFPSKAEKESKE